MPSGAGVTLTREFGERVRDFEVDFLLTLMRGLIAMLVDDDDLVMGDIKLPRQERMLKMLDLAERGVLDELRIIAPKRYEKMITELRADMRAEGLPDPVRDEA